MATRMDEVQAELKQARLSLSNAHADIDRLGVVSTQLKKVRCAQKVHLYTGVVLYTIRPNFFITGVTGEYINCVASFPK